MTPPGLPRWLLARLLPYDHRSVVIGELDEEFEVTISPARSRLAASRWYWRNAMASVPGALRLRTRAFLTDVGGDLRYGWRLLWRNPAFAFAAVLTFALGIATASAVLTVANAVLLRPLPYASPDRVVIVTEIDRSRDAVSNFSWPDFLDYQAQNRTLTALAGFNGGSRTFSAPGEPTTQVQVMLVTADFFDVLGVPAARGRTLTADDMPASAAPVLVLTDRSWRARFGADPGVVGTVVTLGGRATQIVGVMPPDFEFPLRGSMEFVLPEHPSQAQLERKYFHWLDGIGRLRPGVTIAQADDDLSRIARGFATIDPRAHANYAAHVVPIRDRIVGNVRPTMWLLAVASLVVLIVACANIAGLLLARSAVRVDEMALRSALGAGRMRLFRQLVAEQLALALPSLFVGVVGGYWMMATVLATMPPARRLSLPHLGSLRLDTTALAIGVTLTVAATLLFGLLPAMRAARRTHVPFARGVAGAGAHELRWQSVFVAVQVALALVLLVGAGLMMQSTRRLLDVSPGFNPNGLLTLTAVLPGSRYNGQDAMRVGWADLLARVQALPGVTGAATIDDLPLTGPGNSAGFTVRGDVSARETITLIRTVSPNYFDTMGIPLEAGRGFDPGAGSAAPPVVLVNRVLADRAFAGQPIGQRVTFPFTAGVDWEIAGIVGNEQFDALDHELRPVVYFSSVQTSNNVFSVAVHTTGDPAALAGPVRAEVARMDSAIPVFGVTTMDEILRSTESVYRRRSVLALIGIFAAATVLLAAVGLYGVLAQIVAQRRREIGVRVALGAAAPDIVRTVVGRGLVAVAIGLLAGLAASVLLARSLDNLLYRTSPTDLPTFALVTGVLVLTSLLSCLIPARRALGVDPARVLRDER